MHHIFNLAADKEAKVHEHLVVARAARVDFLAHIAKAAREHQFHLRVHILNAVFNHEFASLNLGVNLAQGSGEQGKFVGGEQIDGLQHSDVGDRAKHVVASQIEVHFTVAPHGVGFHIVVNLYVFFPKF